MDLNLLCNVLKKKRKENNIKRGWYECIFNVYSDLD